MNNKSHYIVDIYQPSDQKDFITTTLKLQKLGDKEPVYIWINIEGTGGIGTGLDNFGKKDKEDALMGVIAFLGDTSKHIYTDNFQEVLDLRDKLIKQFKPDENA